jgi:hypothetical protein
MLPILVLLGAIAVPACRYGTDEAYLPGRRDAAEDALGKDCAGDGTCGSGQRCAIVCDGTSAAQRCEADPGTGAGFGEACGGGQVCRRGACIGGAAMANGAPGCVPFCASDQDCDGQSTCKQVSLQYNCPTGVASLMVKLCRPR